MQQFFNNRYVQMAGLTLGLALLLYAVLWVATLVMNLRDFPQPLLVMLSFLGAGLVVYKFFAQRIV